MKATLVEKAVRIAVRAHKDQVRKESDLPYIAHPFMVALKLSQYVFEDIVIASALVHDVLEDTPFTIEELEEELGREVLDIVLSLTNDDSLPWDDKKKKYIETVRSGSNGAKAVATADKIHNLESLLIALDVDGDKVWVNFNRGMEKKIWFEEEMFRMLKETWQHPMVEEYRVLLDSLKDKISTGN